MVVQIWGKRWDKRRLQGDGVVVSTHLANTLRRNGVTTMAQLAALDKKELLAMRGFGKKGLWEVQDLLKGQGIVCHMNPSTCPYCGRPMEPEQH